MAKMFGTVTYVGYGDHEYACLDHAPEVSGDTFPLRLSDVREEAFVCDTCDALILPSEDTWLESEDEDQQAFIASGREI